MDVDGGYKGSRGGGGFKGSRGATRVEVNAHRAISITSPIVAAVWILVVLS